MLPDMSEAISFNSPVPEVPGPQLRGDPVQGDSHRKGFHNYSFSRNNTH